MLSLYIHIPFCDKKCGYCSFNVVPTSDVSHEKTLIDQYVDALCAEIKQWGERLGKKELYTIYFGGGTPSKLSFMHFSKILSVIEKYFDIENIGELSIECNPYPMEDVYNLIRDMQKTYTHFPRIRRSVGIQTFDPDILKESGRQYSFPAITEFLRGLPDLKKDNSVFNFDFIAFGKFATTRKGNKKLWDDVRMGFFQNFVQSMFADSFSLYTLELFPGSNRYNELRKKEKNTDFISQKYGTDDDVYAEFDLLKNIILEAGYQRYELSNFAVASKRSLHNRVYWSMQNYIGLGTSAASYMRLTDDNQSLFTNIFGNKIDDYTKGIRRKNNVGLKPYIAADYINKDSCVALDEKDILIESFFLGLRTDSGVKNISLYTSVMVSDWEQKITDYAQQGLLMYMNDIVCLTDQGMDVFNTIITEILQEI